MKYLVAVKGCSESPYYKVGSHFPSDVCLSRVLRDSVDEAIQKHFEVFSRIDTPLGDPFYFMLKLQDFLLYSVQYDEEHNDYMIVGVTALDAVDIG